MARTVAPGHTVRHLLSGLVGIAAVTGLVLTLTTSTQAAPQRQPGDGVGQGTVQQTRRHPLLVPDVRSVPARDMYIQVHGDVRRLRFESAIASTGDGPVEIRSDNRRPCPAGQKHASQIIYRDVNENGRYNPAIDTQTARRSAGCMLFHPTHNHWHFDAAARYALYPVHKDRAVTKHKKASFCFRDSRRTPPAWGVTTRYAARYGACDRDNPQGISIGWADVYQAFLPGQSLRLPKRMPNGRYCLRVAVDPLRSLIETDDQNNRSAQALRIRGTKVERLARRICR